MGHPPILNSTPLPCYSSMKSRSGMLWLCWVVKKNPQVKGGPPARGSSKMISKDHVDPESRQTNAEQPDGRGPMFRWFAPEYLKQREGRCGYGSQLRNHREQPHKTTKTAKTTKVATIRKKMKKKASKTDERRQR